MVNHKLEQIPASWSCEPASFPNGTSVNGNHTNGHVHEASNGRSYGHSNGHTNGSGNIQTQIPESFLEGKSVRTVYGLVPLKYALDWPVFASYDELSGCAAWMGGRIPTFEETKSIYAYVHVQKRAQAERKLGKTVPAVNGYVIQTDLP